MSTFLEITTAERPAGNNVEDLASYSERIKEEKNNNNNMSVINSLAEAFKSSKDVSEENIFAKNTGLNIFVSNFIDDKQDIVDNITKVIDEKFGSIDEKLYRIDELIDKFATCKAENEQLKAKFNSLKDENYILKNELNKFNPLVFGLFKKK